MIIVQWIATLWAAWLGWSIWRYHRPIGRRFAVLAAAPPLQPSSEVGQYVQFAGHLMMQGLRSPFAKVPCSYWALRVRAVFKTKRRKPSRGMQTHQPVIYQAESDEQPLLCHDRKQLVQLLLKSPQDCLLNPQKQQHRSRAVPLEAVQDKVLPKYQSYVTEEVTLPPQAEVMVWGKVIDRNAHCVTLSGSPYDDQAAALLYGNRARLNRLRWRNRCYIGAQLLAVAALLYALHGWMPLHLDEEQQIIASFVGIVSVYMVRALARRLARK